MSAKKGQKFNRYSEDTKKEAVHLRTQEQWSYAALSRRRFWFSSTGLLPRLLDSQCLIFLGLPVLVRYL